MSSRTLALFRRHVIHRSTPHFRLLEALRRRPKLSWCGSVKCPLSPHFHHHRSLSSLSLHFIKQRMLSALLPSSIYSLLLTLHLLTPVNASLSLLLLGLLLSLIPSTSPSIPSYPLPATHTLGYYNYRPRHSKPTKWETYTPQELSQFNGNQQGGKVLIAIRRKVYDVTSGKSFYGPGKLITLRLGE